MKCDGLIWGLWSLINIRPQVVLLILMGLFKGVLIIEPLEVLPVYLLKPQGSACSKSSETLNSDLHRPINTQQRKLLIVGKTLEAVKHRSWYAVSRQAGFYATRERCRSLGMDIEKGLKWASLFLLAEPSAKQHRDDDCWDGLGER